VDRRTRILNPENSEKLQERVSSLRYTELFVGAFLAALLLPTLLPTVTENPTWIFVVIITLSAWMIIKWDSLKVLKNRSSVWEVALGVGVIAAVYAENYALHKVVGLIDMAVIAAAIALVFYGFRSARFFLVPAVYLGILIFGYWLEFNLPELVGLEIWEANLMAGIMQGLGITTTVSGNIVTLATPTGPLALQVANACTGIKGILAFGTLSSMAVLDIKLSPKRLVVILAIGFLGTFLTDLVRLASIFLTFFYVGVAAGETMHIYLGYSLFIAWVLIYWTISFKYLIPRAASPTAGVISTAGQQPSFGPGVTRSLAAEASSRPESADWAASKLRYLRIGRHMSKLRRMKASPETT
jgi:exosortase